jgi:hypothetical protein
MLLAAARPLTPVAPDGGGALLALLCDSGCQQLAELLEQVLLQPRQGHNKDAEVLA